MDPDRCHVHYLRLRRARDELLRRLSEETNDTGDAVTGAMTGDEYPHLAEMARAAARPGNTYADAFTFGLDLILDALDELRA